MKKFWKSVIICVVALGVLAATCPGKQRHVDAGVKYMSNALHKQAKTIEKTYKEQHNNQEMPDEGKQLMTQLQESLISQMKPAVENVLVVKNYVLPSNLQCGPSAWIPSPSSLLRSSRHLLSSAGSGCP